MAGARPTLSVVMSGSQCLGMILSRGRMGVEAFDADEESLGLFDGPEEARDAILKASAT